IRDSLLSLPLSQSRRGASAVRVSIFWIMMDGLRRIADRTVVILISFIDATSDAHRQNQRENDSH
ncbi:MAG TPA: hypothetical protein VFS68_03730, partial [Candidatus Udaeobacter sp.]|nr:hypothetical protein [Candidatus Udaeobacter sp.]